MSVIYLESLRQINSGLGRHEDCDLEGAYVALFRTIFGVALDVEVIGYHEFVKRMGTDQEIHLPLGASELDSERYFRYLPIEPQSNTGWRCYVPNSSMLEFSNIYRSIAQMHAVAVALHEQKNYVCESKSILGLVAAGAYCAAGFIRGRVNNRVKGQEPWLVKSIAYARQLGLSL